MMPAGDGAGGQADTPGDLSTVQRSVRAQQQQSEDATPVLGEQEGWK